MQEAKGTFDVRMTVESDAPVARMALVKSFHGDLEGNSVGTMLSAGNPAEGSAGYVAIENVTASLAGRQGGFSLQHSGTMHAGEQTLAIAVVPGSGTGALAGISGSITIAIEGGVHSYALRYSLSD